MCSSGILSGSFIAVPLENGPRIYGCVVAYDPTGVLIEVHRLNGKWKCDDALEQFYVPFHIMHGYVKVEDECDNCGGTLDDDDKGRS